MEDDDIAAVVAGFAPRPRSRSRRAATASRSTPASTAWCASSCRGSPTSAATSTAPTSCASPARCWTAVRAAVGPGARGRRCGCRATSWRRGPGITPECGAPSRGRGLGAAWSTTSRSCGARSSRSPATRPDGHDAAGLQHRPGPRACAPGASDGAGAGGAAGLGRRPRPGRGGASTAGAATRVEMTRAQIADPDLVAKLAAGDARPDPALHPLQPDVQGARRPQPARHLRGRAARPATRPTTPTAADRAGAARAQRRRWWSAAGRPGWRAPGSRPSRGHRVTRGRAARARSAARVRIAGRRRRAASGSAPLVDWLDGRVPPPRRGRRARRRGRPATARRGRRRRPRSCCARVGARRRRRYTVEGDDRSPRAVIDAAELLARADAALPGRPGRGLGPHRRADRASSVAETLAGRRAATVTLVTPDLIVGNELLAVGRPGAGQRPAAGGRRRAASKRSLRARCAAGGVTGRGPVHGRAARRSQAAARRRCRAPAADDAPVARHGRARRPRRRRRGAAHVHEAMLEGRRGRALATVGRAR